MKKILTTTQTKTRISLAKSLVMGIALVATALTMTIFLAHLMTSFRYLAGR